MRKYREEKTTDSSYVFKRVVHRNSVKCGHCSPGKGCNRKYRWNPSKSWKDQSKKIKQWM
ncbi:MAG: hypothetical protein ACOC1K_05480 [Nanoarchaeota archaeon]